MAKTILLKQTSAGQSVEVRVHENAPGRCVVHVYLDGQFVAGPARPMALEPPAGSNTHYVGGGYGGRPIVELSDMEAGLIVRALDNAESDSRVWQVGEKRALQARRRDLMMDYRRLLQRQQTEYESALAAGRPDAEQVRRAHETRIAAVQRAMRDFDREHPDIIEAVLEELGPGPE